ncbi:MAG: DUF6155 family protein [Clostridium sp.]|nr:DUF6155 family protein [Clostridium sp.]
MSKAQLKKALKDLSTEDLTYLLVQVYENRKEAKEYLDFWMNPDIDRKREEISRTIEKELQRVGRGKSKTRVSEIRKAVKRFASYEPETEMLLGFMLEVFMGLLAVNRKRWTTASFRNGTASFLNDSLEAVKVGGMPGDWFSRFVRLAEAIDVVYAEDRALKEQLGIVITNFTTKNPFA